MEEVCGRCQMRVRVADLVLGVILLCVGLVSGERGQAENWDVQALDAAVDDQGGTAWGSRRRRHSDARRRHSDARRRRTPMKCLHPTRTGIDFSSCNAVSRRRNSWCSVPCAAGYRGSAKNVHCLDKHNRQGNLDSRYFPTCRPIPCTQREPQWSLDRSNCAGVGTGATCRSVCATGWSKDGKGKDTFTTLNCMANQVLDGSDPTCLKNTCAAPKLPACEKCLPVGSSTYYFSGCDGVKTLDNCTATCSQGYSLAAESKNAIYMNEDRKLYSVDNTDAAYNSFHKAIRADLTRVPPANAVRTQSVWLTCPAAAPNQPLSNPQPTCHANKCARPQVPVSVNFTDCEGKKTTDTCRADCAYGYWETGVWGVGATALRCDENGQFTSDLSTVLPVCEPKPCRAVVPNEPLFGKPYPEDYSILDPRKFSTPMQLRLEQYTHDLTGYKHNLNKFSTPVVGGVNFTDCQGKRTGETCKVMCYPGFGTGVAPGTEKNQTHQVNQTNQTNASVPTYAPTQGITDTYGETNPMFGFRDHPMPLRRTVPISFTLTCDADGHFTGRMPSCPGERCFGQAQNGLGTEVKLPKSTLNRRRGNTLNSWAWRRIYGISPEFKTAFDRSSGFLANVTGADFSGCKGMTTTQQCVPTCKVGPPGKGFLSLKPTSPIACTETGLYVGEPPACRLREPQETKIVLKMELRLLASRVQLVEDHTFVPKIKATFQKLAGIRDMVDENRKAIITPEFPTLEDDITGSKPEDINTVRPLELVTTISGMNKTEGAAVSANLEASLKAPQSSTQGQELGDIQKNTTKSVAPVSFAAEFAAETGVKVVVAAANLAIVNDGVPVAKFDPFVTKLAAPNPTLPHTGGVVRAPGVTPINIQGRYDRNTGEWHKVAPSRQLESDALSRLDQM